MGQQRRIAEALMEHFLLTEDEAWDKVKFVEAVGSSIGDELDGALIALKDDGDLEGTLSDLRQVRDRLNNGITNLSAAFAGVKKRRND